MPHEDRKPLRPHADALVYIDKFRNSFTSGIYRVESKSKWCKTTMYAVQYKTHHGDKVRTRVCIFTPDMYAPYCNAGNTRSTYQVNTAAVHYNILNEPPVQWGPEFQYFFEKFFMYFVGPNF